MKSQKALTQGFRAWADGRTVKKQQCHGMLTGNVVNPGRLRSTLLCLGQHNIILVERVSSERNSEELIKLIEISHAELGSPRWKSGHEEII